MSLTRVLVTGAAGFIGSHVADHLEKSGYEVLRSDLLVRNSHFDGWKRADFTKPGEMDEVTHGIDAVCHVGGVADVYLATANPQLALEVNAVGTLNLLEACKRNKVKRLVYASTWEVYGNPRYQPIDEEHPCFPQHPYNISKFAGELFVRSYGLRGAPATVALRLGTGYGQGMRTNAVIPTFVLKAMRGERVEIQGSGEQFRQFTHISDITEAFRLALESPELVPVFNIVSPEETSIRALAAMIDARIPLATIVREPRRSDIPPAHIDATLARDRLGWRPRIQFKNGLNSLIDDYLKSSLVGSGASSR